MAPLSSWTETEDAAVFRYIVKTALTNRSELYRDPALQGFSGNGGDSINQKLKQLLKRFTNVPGAAAVVAEEVAAMGKNRKTTPTKLTNTFTQSNGAKTPATPKSKKRKSIKEENEDEGEKFSEED